MVRLQEHETKGAPIRAETQGVQMESSPDRSWDQLQLPHSIEHRASKDVDDVPNFWEGSDWIRTWNSSAVLALPGSDPRLAWQTYYDRLGEAKLDLLLIEPCGPNGLRDFVPDNSYGFITFVEHNGGSMVVMAELRTCWRDPSLVPIPADLVAWRALSGHCGAGWDLWKQGRNPCHRAELVVCPHQSCALRASSLSAVPAPRLSAQVVTLLSVWSCPATAA